MVDEQRAEPLAQSSEGCLRLLVLLLPRSVASYRFLEGMLDNVDDRYVGNSSSQQGDTRRSHGCTVVDGFLRSA